MKNEQEFWKNILASCNPGGAATLRSIAATSAGAASEVDTFIYLLDAKTGWVTAGAISSVSFFELHEKLVFEFAKSKLNRDQIFSLAMGKIALCGQMQGDSDSKYSIDAVMAASCALASTNTYDVVQREKGKVSGHWLYIVYSTCRDTLVGRPIYASGPANAFLSGSQLNCLIKKTISLDIDNPSTYVGKQLIEAGGAHLHESIQSLYGDRPDHFDDPFLRG